MTKKNDIESIVDFIIGVYWWKLEDKGMGRRIVLSHFFRIWWWLRFKQIRLSTNGF